VAPALIVPWTLMSEPMNLLVPGGELRAKPERDLNQHECVV
jgi:hypothetical protein